MNTAVLEKVFNCPTLPSLPSIAIEVLELTADDSVPVAKIAKVIQNDQALAAKILKTINSSFYGLAKPCPTISRAVAYLGMNTVKSLALGFSVIDLQAEGGGAFDPMAHWRRCVYGGAGARIIGEYLVSRDAASGPEVDGDPEEMFIAALLQDVGVLAMFTALGEEYDDVIAGAGRDHDRLAALEQAAFGVDHAEVGALLGEKWRLPTSLAELIRYHHRT
ncbi:MAG: HDOD domain-containing protein, partial [Phycisphaerales bacterium]|nr:HDOD domain-containing protein [Phycisphaerales bacterium]